MKILIDISEDDYKEVLEDAYSGTSFENRIFSAIQNGTVLTKMIYPQVDGITPTVVSK